MSLSLVYGPSNSEGTWTTNPNGFIELFPEAGYSNGIMVLEKAGYTIFSAEGCSSRNGVANNKGFCNLDGTWKEDSITYDCKNP